MTASDDTPTSIAAFLIIQRLIATLVQKGTLTKPEVNKFLAEEAGVQCHSSNKENQDAAILIEEVRGHYQPEKQ
jgi:hypothetical protein